jgi:hypothetical protein
MTLEPTRIEGSVANHRMRVGECPDMGHRTTRIEGFGGESQMRVVSR